MTSATTSSLNIETTPCEFEEGLCKEIGLIVGKKVDRDTDLINQCDLDSFSITQIMVFLEQTFGIEIPNERMNSESYCSISHIAQWALAIQPKTDGLAAIAPQTENMSFRMVDLAKHKSIGPTVFIAPTQSGMHFRYQELISYFPENLQVKGVQIRLSGSEAIQTPDIKSMAAAMVDVMRKEQPDGPYHLLGFCFGASLAAEMAVRLEQQNQKVGFLGLIDILLPNISERKVAAIDKATESDEVNIKSRVRRPLNWLKRKMTWHASALSILEPGEYPRYLSKIIADRFRGRDSGKDEIMGSNSVDQLIDATHRAFALFDPSVYTGAVNIFNGELDDSSRHASPDQIARHFKGPTTITTVPGLHTFVLEDPWVRILGKEISTQMKHFWSQDDWRDNWGQSKGTE